MSSPYHDLNSCWAELLIEELCRHGVRQFCISPGSRSTPLVLAIASSARAQSLVHYDERGAAFYALGYARATGEPVVIITTSGTAAANLYPAVIEASNDNIPLLLLTADRPPELRDTSANQTIDQVKMFGGYVRWQFDFPCPDIHIHPEMLLTTAAHAAFRSRHPEPGPVHLNCMFREPLSPVATDDTPMPEAYISHLNSWRSSDRPYTQYSFPHTKIENETIMLLSERISGSERGLIVVGQLRLDRDRKAVFSLAERLGWPVLPDISSGLRLNDHPSLIAGYDLALGSEKVAQMLAPDFVLQIGGRLTSKRLQKFLKQTGTENYILINRELARLDPNDLVREKINADTAIVCETLSGCFPKGESTAYAALWQSVNSETEQALKATLSETENLTEALTARLLSRFLRESHALFLASSMPIRLMDMYAALISNLSHVASNRGASGIDGTLASAAGYAAASKRPTTCLIGDVAALHDLNSFVLVKDSEIPMIIVILNNDGGRIFNLLPVSEVHEYFQRYFVAPHGLDFSYAAKMFGLTYRSPASIQDFTNCYSEFAESGSSAIIEIMLRPEQDYEQHRKILDNVSTRLLSLFAKDFS